MNLKKFIVRAAAVLWAGATLAGVGTMSSAPLWDLAANGGTRTISSASPTTVPNAAFPDFNAFTVEATVTFGAIADRQAFRLFDQTVSETGWGLQLVRDANSGSPVYLVCNGQSYNCAQALGSVTQGSSHTFTVAARDGWLVVYMDGAVKKSFLMRAVPNLADLKVGGAVTGGWAELAPLTLTSLKVWGSGEKFYASGESQEPASGYVGGNGWLVEVPTAPLAGMPNILYVGDSISEGYKASFKNLLAGRANLYHWSTFFGTAGSAGIPAAKIREIGDLAAFDHVVFNNGLHSLGWTESAVSDANVRESYRTLAAAFRAAAPQAALHYLATTPHTAAKGSDGVVRTTGDKDAVVQRLNRLAKVEMDAAGVPYADAYSLLLGHLDLASGDGYHWTAPAYDLLARFIVAELALAEPTVYTYVGADGRWNAPANWNPRGVPGAGDGACFTSATTVTGDVPLPGMVHVDVADNVQVTLSGALHGPGGVTKRGNGTLVVSGNNAFAGSFVVSNGVVRARGPNALGDNASGTVEIHANDRNTLLYLGGVHVRKPLELRNCSDAGIGYTSFFRTEPNTTNRVSGPVSVPRPYLRMICDRNSRIDFAGGGSLGAVSYFGNRWEGAEIRILERPMSYCNTYSSQLAPGWLVFGVPGCLVEDKSRGNQLCTGNRRTTVDGALHPDSVLNGGMYVLDLDGTEQVIRQLFGREPSRPGEVRSRTTARLTLTDTAQYTNTCVFTGLASLTLAGASDRTVTLTGASTSDGVLTVEAGKTAVFALDGSWRGGVVVKGTLRSETATALAQAAYVDVCDGGVLDLPAGAVRGRQFRANGVPSAATGATRTWIGTDGVWAKASNWSPAGVPGPGDTAAFTASATFDGPIALPGGVTTLAEGAGATVTFNGTLSGADATLVHNGSGTLVLSGTNTFTGAFTNLAGTVKVPTLARAGVPSPLGAPTGAAAAICNNGVFHVTGDGATDRPYHGGTSAQWNVDGTLAMSGPVSGRTWWRQRGKTVLAAPCPSISAFNRTDDGTVEMACPTNTFAASVNFFAGRLVAGTLAPAGLPCSIGRGSLLNFGQSSYCTPTAFVYGGRDDVSCDRTLRISSNNGKVAGRPSTYAQHDGLTFTVQRAGTKVTWTGPVELGNADAANPFLLCDGAGDLEMTAPVPDRFHLWKAGAGTWTLAGSNASTGVCTVASGRLDLDGSFAAGMTLDVHAGATFGGTGVVAARTTLAAGATLAAGSKRAFGTLTFPVAPTLSAGTRVVLKVGAEGHDALSFAGGPDFPASLTVALEIPRGDHLVDGTYELMAWDAPPATVFSLEGPAGCSLAKTASGLALTVARGDGFQVPTPSATQARILKVGPGETVRTPAAAQAWVRAARADGTLRKGEPVTVLLAPGDYVLDDTLAFTAQDGGTAAAPVVWRAAERGAVRFLGAPALDAARFAALPADDPLRARLDAAAADAVVAADVSDLLPAAPSAWPSSGRTPPAPWLWLGGAFQEVARWPNRASEDAHGWTSFDECTSAGLADRTGVAFLTTDDRAARWNFSEGVWLYGYWGQTWDENYVQAARWNAGTREMTLAGAVRYVPTLGRNSVARKYVAVNVAEELDAPGEWWLDRARRRLYYLPAAGFGSDELVLTAFDRPLVSLGAGLGDLRFEHVTFAYAGRAFQAQGETARVVFDGCAFHSLAYASSLQGRGNAVRHCDFAHLGQGGVNVTGGSVRTLEHARNLVEDCAFTDFERWQQTYAPAVSLQGCGNAVRDCVFGKAAHEAVTYGGNEHLVGWSEFHEVLRESEDCGAIYTGRNTSTLGTQLVGNFFHDLDTGNVTGIYFDDNDWGDDAVGNVFENVYRAFLVGGGNLHRLQWNVMRKGEYGLYVDRRGVTWEGRSDWVTGDDWYLRSFESAKIDPRAWPWTAAYPELETVLDDTPREPWYNVFRGNLVEDYKTFTTLQKTATASSYYPSTNRMDIADNVTASTTGKSGTGLPGFTHLQRAATEADVPGMEAGLARVADLRAAPVVETASPDGIWRVRFGLDVTARLCCRASLKGVDMLDHLPVGVTVDGVDHGRMAVPGVAVSREVRDAYAVPEASAPGYVETTFPLTRVVDGTRDAEVDVRTFGAGFAFRMRVAGTGTRHVAGELTYLASTASGEMSYMPGPVTGWTCEGAVTTAWHVVLAAAPAVTNGVLYLDVPAGASRAPTILEEELLKKDGVAAAVKTGGGTLLLEAPLTGYTGTWGVSNGFVQVSAPADAFGSPGDAAVTALTRRGSGGWGLDFLSACTVSRPVTLACDDYQSLRVRTGAEVRFTRPFTSTGANMRLEIEEGGRCVFAGGAVKASGLFVLSGGGTLAFEETPVNINAIYAQHSVTTRFDVPSNRVASIYCAYAMGGRIVCGCDDALSGQTTTVESTQNYTFDLAGHRLAVGRFKTMTSGGLTSSGAPGTLHFTQTTRITNEACAVTGQLNLWKSGAAEFALARRVDSSGGLAVDQGVFRMTRAASWPQAAFVSVTGTGTLVVEGDGAFPGAPPVKIAGSGKIQMPAGVTFACASLLVGGRYQARGDYASGKFAFVTGGGTVRVVARPGLVLSVR